MSGFDDLADRLDAVAEELSERAIDDEKRLTQARRAVEKAAHLLRGATEA
jgi:hypothetical protein